MTFLDLFVLSTTKYAVHIIQMPYFDAKNETIYILVGNIPDPDVFYSN